MCTTWRWSVASVVGAVSLSLGCSSQEPKSVMPGGGDGSNLPDAGNPPDAPGGTTGQALPMTISDHFIPSGYMGDGASSTTVLMVRTTGCKLPRPATAVGDCYRVTYKPAVDRWAGVYWQYPENNWGASPGKKVEAGATKVTFYAAGAAGGEVLQFLAGGEMDTSLPYHDSFKAGTMITLTSSLTQYQIDITGKTYESGVLGGFAWTVAAPQGSTATIEFYLDTL